MPRASDADKETFRDLVAHLPGVRVKPMFANLGAFVGGWMFAALIGDTVGIKLRNEEVLEEVRSLPGARAFGPGPKPLRDYVGIGIDHPRDELTEWIEVAYFETSALPPKGSGARSE